MASKELKDSFTKLDVHSRTLIFEAKERIETMRKGDEDLLMSEEGTTLQKEVYALFTEIREDLDQMRDMASDFDAIKNSRIASPRVVDEAKTLNLTVQSLQDSLRLLHKQFEEWKNQKMRQELMSTTTSRFGNEGLKKRGAGPGELSSGSTESMLNSRRILLETVQRSAGTISTLAASSSSVTDNQEELKGQGSILVQSKKLLTKYGRRESTDKILICLALILFFACVTYIIQKRMF